MDQYDCDYQKMKPAGTVDQFVEVMGCPEPHPDAVFTVQLDRGSTPHLARPHGGDKEFRSNTGRFTDNRACVTHAWYRPNRFRFDGLKTAERMHVLKGGLLLAPLALALTLQTRVNFEGVHASCVDINSACGTPVYDPWLAYCHAHYGVKPADWEKRDGAPKTNPQHDPYPVKPDLGGEGGGA